MDQFYVSLQEHAGSWLEQFPYTGSQVRVAATTATLAFVTYKVINILVIGPYKSPLKLLPGPEADSICESTTVAHAWVAFTCAHGSFGASLRQLSFSV